MSIFFNKARQLDKNSISFNTPSWNYQPGAPEKGKDKMFTRNISCDIYTITSSILGKIIKKTISKVHLCDLLTSGI